MKILKTLQLFAVMAAFALSANAGKIQKQDIKTSAECIAAGATDATCLPTTAQIYESITAQKLSSAFSSSIVGTLLGESKVSLTADVANTLPVGNGGSGAASFTANNVLLGNGSSAFQTVAPSTNGNILQSNGTTWQSVANPAAPQSSQEISNIGFVTSVSANALTIALKQSDGSSDCTVGSPCKIGFRSSTVTSGAFNQRSITSSLSITVPASTTLGTLSNIAEYLYIYAIDNAGTVELAVSSGGPFADQGAVQTTSAVSGCNGRTLICSSTARSSLPIRVIGRIKITESTAGTWATGASEVSVFPFPYASVSSIGIPQLNVESATITGSATTPSINGAYTGWITFTTRNAAGDYTFTMNGFSAAPSCTCSPALGGTASNHSCTFVSDMTTTTVRFFEASSGGTGTDGEKTTLICVGPR